MMYLGFEPGATRLYAQSKPQSYGIRPSIRPTFEPTYFGNVCAIVHFIIVTNCQILEK